MAVIAKKRRFHGLEYKLVSQYKTRQRGEAAVLRYIKKGYLARLVSIMRGKDGYALYVHRLPTKR